MSSSENHIEKDVFNSNSEHIIAWWNVLSLTAEKQVSSIWFKYDFDVATQISILSAYFRGADIKVLQISKVKIRIASKLP